MERGVSTLRLTAAVARSFVNRHREANRLKSVCRVFAGNTFYTLIIAALVIERRRMRASVRFTFYVVVTLLCLLLPFVLGHREEEEEGVGVFFFPVYSKTLQNTCEASPLRVKSKVDCPAALSCLSAWFCVFLCGFRPECETLRNACACMYDQPTAGMLCTQSDPSGHILEPSSGTNVILNPPGELQGLMETQTSCC